MVAVDYTFGCVTSQWYEIKYLDEVYFEHILSSNLRFEDYGKDVESILVEFLAVSDFSLESLGGLKPTRFFSQKKQIIGNILLDFQAMMNAQSPEESRQIQAEGYLKFLDSLKHHRSLRKADFNAQKLYEDTKNLFEREGWVKKVEVKI